MKNLSTYGFAALVLLLLPSLAFADGHCAATTVRNINVREDGQVRVSLSSAPAEPVRGDAVNTKFQYKFVCDIDTAVNGILTGTCLKWVDILTASFLSGKPVVLWYTAPPAGTPILCAPADTWGDASAYLTNITLGNY
jgi:hypothetical protein